MFKEALIVHFFLYFMSLVSIMHTFIFDLKNKNKNRVAISPGKVREFSNWPNKSGNFNILSKLWKSQEISLFENKKKVIKAVIASDNEFFASFEKFIEARLLIFKKL